MLRFIPIPVFIILPGTCSENNLMVKIRLSRFGSKKHPYYHIVVCDSESPRDGKFLEQVGTYDPSQPIEQARVNLNRIEHWRKTGAQPTDTVRKIIRCSEKLAVAEPAS